MMPRKMLSTDTTHIWDAALVFPAVVDVAALD
jgi:hypothetical protein